ncbi:amino acid dehydrogenase [uncultured Neptuniibacter sp.]|uniref:Leu/Phe/Val dehydrogenase n=1 Tax=uncultured Neptuniibacter sp. TaxID=502143 RepID=UPI00263699FC|nr:amino acid dehydrogenase [uncultured Neptuniibacter sp.]
MFKQMESNGAQRLHFCSDPATGLKAIIAIHSTLRGPAIGGCRFISYQNDNDAITDAMRLARGMSYKSALAGLPHGGAKSVLIYPDHPFDRAALMQQFGQFVTELGGEYITAMDSGTQISDMDNISMKTRWVTCTSEIGDPSPHTALGVFEGIKASVKFKLGLQSLSGLHVTIQGVGHVGYEVARLLHQAGAILTVSDMNTEPVKRCQRDFQASAVAPDDIYSVPAEVFCPCGLGAILNDEHISQLQVPIIAGSANNQLAQEHHGDQLKDKGILYAPDYLINSGGLIFVALQYAKQPAAMIRNKVIRIGDSLLHLYKEAEQSGTAIHRLADERAQSIIASAGKMTSAA